MKLATLPGRRREGQLIVVSRDLKRFVPARDGLSLLDALRDWKGIEPELQKAFADLEAKPSSGSLLDLKKCLAPLPYAPGFYDGSAFLSHVDRARRARGDTMPASAKVTPLMYQGVSDALLPAFAPLEIVKEEYGGDFEGEFAVLVTDTPREITSENAAEHIALFMLFNDVTLREIVKTELETKFGFLQSKPNSSFAPVVVTPDELGGLWHDGRVHAELFVKWNGEVFGHPNGSEMHFTFGDLIAHAARTRPLTAGSIVGCGTVSNADARNGFACLTEKRFQEILEHGSVTTRWLRPGDHVFMEVLIGGHSVFGPIDQKVVVKV